MTDPQDDPFAYLREQLISWKDLNYNNRLSRERDDVSLDGMSGLDISSLIQRGAIPASLLSGVGASQLKTGTLYQTIDVGRASDNAYVRMDGPNNRIVVHDGSNPRVAIGNV